MSKITSAEFIRSAVHDGVASGCSAIVETLEDEIRAKVYSGNVELAEQALDNMIAEAYELRGVDLEATDTDE